MRKIIFRRVLPFVFFMVFIETSLLPLIESTSIHESVTTDSSVYNSTEGYYFNYDENLRGRPDGLASKTIPLQKSLQQNGVFTGRNNFYAYNAYDPSGGHPPGPITFETPDEIISLAPGIAPNFIAGSDIDLLDYWYGCDYAGGLYLINQFTGAMTFIAPTIGINGMTLDDTANTWYVTSSNNLYSMDITTGATTLIGPHNLANTVIGLACDLEGIMYAYDVLWTGDSTLYSINKETGAASAIGLMGYGFVYAQDCAYDPDYGTLYIAGYFNDGSPSALLTCDVETAECTIVDSFEGSMEIDGLTKPGYPPPPVHDISIQRINKPSSGNVTIFTPEVKVKNQGLYEYEYNVPINLRIGKELVTGALEDFEETNGSYIHFPKIPQPDAWQWGAPTSGPMAAHSGNNVWATNLVGNYPPSMWCILQTTPFVVPFGTMFNFWHWYYFENNYDGGNVKITTDGGATYTIITPVGGYPGSMPYNPYMTNQPAYNGNSNGWIQANFDLSDYEGQTVQIMFETASDGSVQYPGWYIDDVGFTTTTGENEYNQTVTIPIFEPGEIINVSFPTWTPADLGLSENININYNAEATGLLVGDLNPNNDYKSKLFNLHYGFLHDVAVTEIISPESGLATPQTPEVTIENHGQNNESVAVTMTIGKTLYTTLLEEDFATGVPPAGWGTNYPENWMSSSTNYAGGVAPEAEFSWSPSSVDEHYLWTGNIDTTGFTAVLLKFKEYVNDFNGDYYLKVVTSTDGGTSWQTAYERAGGPYGPATTEVTLTAANGIGSATFQIAWDMSGDSFNINYWYIDDVWMGIIEVDEEYNETVNTPISAGTSMNVTLPIWIPADISFATTIEYLIDTTVSMNVSDGHPTDNELSKLITLTYEHDVGVIEIIIELYIPTMDHGFLRNPQIVYNLSGIIKNFGISCSEVDIPVNTQITQDDIVIYDETVIFPGPLAPGATATVYFQEITIPENSSGDGFYMLTMQTLLPNDDHPNNNKKSITWERDVTPPFTEADVSGTMGQNGWYVSDVQVVLTGMDNHSGVYTLFKVDNGFWEIYETPILISTDGPHIVYFWSEDSHNNQEELKNVSFKIDKTAPVFSNYTFTPLNILKNKWLCNATVEDPTSGVELVVFYVDGVLVGNATAKPYEFVYDGIPTQSSQALAFDAAGNAAYSSVAQYYELNYQIQQFFQKKVFTR